VEKENEGNWRGNKYKSKASREERSERGMKEKSVMNSQKHVSSICDAFI